MKLGENRPELLLFYGHKVTEKITEACLSQWYPCQFAVDGVTCTSAEQYMMAEKAKLFGDEEIDEVCRPGGYFRPKQKRV